MTENHHASGNRWEDDTAPVAGAPTTPPPPAAPAAATAVADAPPPPYDAAYPGPPAPHAKPTLRQRIGRVPRAAWLSAAAVVVVVGVGLGGFFIGRATAPDDGGGDGRFPFENGQRPDFGDGQMPGNGQMPGMPGQQGQPSDSTDDGTSDGTTDSSADTTADSTAWYVVPAAA